MDLQAWPYACKTSQRHVAHYRFLMAKFNKIGYQVCKIILIGWHELNQNPERFLRFLRKRCLGGVSYRPTGVQIKISPRQVPFGCGKVVCLASVLFGGVRVGAQVVHAPVQRLGGREHLLKKKRKLLSTLVCNKLEKEVLKSSG